MKDQNAPSLMTDQMVQKRFWSRKMILILVAVSVIAILLSVALLYNRGLTPFSGGGVTFISLQEDYDAWNGNFKSYNTGDTVVFRDTVTSVEIGANPYGNPVTILYFRAHALPSMDDFSNGQYTQQSWWTYYREGGFSSYNTPFWIKGSSSSGYLPEGGIQVRGDIRDQVSVGSTVQITLHFVDGWWSDPRHHGITNTECIKELTYPGSTVKPEDLQILR